MTESSVSRTIKASMYPTEAQTCVYVIGTKLKNRYWESNGNRKELDLSSSFVQKLDFGLRANGIRDTVR